MVIAVKIRVASTTLVEHHVVKTIQSALWRMVRLADQLRVIASVRSTLQEAWPDIPRVVTRHRQPPVVPLVHSRYNASARRRTRGHGGVRVG